MSNLKNAVLLTGVGARISQEVALFDYLIKQKELSISEESTYLAGFSSGALNVLAINACFRKENPCSWDKYYKDEVLKNLNNEDVYIKTHPVYWDTLPLRRTLKMFLKNANIKKLNDLTFQSDITAFNIDKMKTYWANSYNSKYMNIELCDLLMATTAIPVIFPSQRINGIGGQQTGLPAGIYSDGGSDGIFKRLKRHLRKIVKSNITFETLHIISPMRENNVIGNNNLNHLKFDHENDSKMFNDFWEHVSMNGFISFLKKIQKANNKFHIANTIFVSIPNMKENSGILDFSDQMDQYESVKQWCELNPEKTAINLDQFLEKYSI